MKESTIQELQKEIEHLNRLNEIVAKQALLDARTVKMLVAAGFVTDEKVDEARALLRPLA